MNKPMLVVVGVLVIVGIIIAISVGAGPAGRFADAGSCAELQRMFDAEPVSNDAADRRAVGEEFRAKADQLGC